MVLNDSFSNAYLFLEVLIWNAQSAIQIWKKLLTRK